MWGKWLILCLAVLGIIILLSLLCWIWLVSAAKRVFQKEIEQDTAKVLEILPQSDCGICGMGTCEAFAKQAAYEQAFSLPCPYFHDDDRQRLTQYFKQRKSERESTKNKTDKLKNEVSL